MTTPAPYASTAWPILGVGLFNAGLCAYLFKDTGVLSLIPPGATEPDAVGREFWLHASAYTAWVALILLIPAYLTVWRQGETWRAFWMVAFVAYVIHLAVSMFGFFGGDFAWMTSTTRVSAFWPGMILVPWWALDLWLSRSQTRPVMMQRIVLHVATFVLFFGGSAIMGELSAIKLLGWAFLVAVLAGVALWLKERRA